MVWAWEKEVYIEGSVRGRHAFVKVAMGNVRWQGRCTKAEEKEKEGKRKKDADRKRKRSWSVFVGVCDQRWVIRIKEVEEKDQRWGRRENEARIVVGGMRMVHCGMTLKYWRVCRVQVIKFGGSAG